MADLPMGLLPDWAIRDLARAGMIDPFVPEKVGAGVISFGLSTYGYDMTLGRQFKVLRRDMPAGFVLDPKRVPPELFADVETDVLELPPLGCALGRSVEYWQLPRNVFALVIGKSTYARSFQLPLMTPMENGWHGTLTLELVNLTPYPVKLYAGEGVAQAVFFRGSAPAKSYGDAGGKYNGQVGVTPGFVAGAHGAKPES